VTAESTVTAEGTVPAGNGPNHWTWLRRRAPLVACFVLLVALPFATAPGEIIADTKFELAVDPARFLSSALTLWNPQQFGGLADQYVGYLFPMGPFFELARLLAVPGWVAQRLWLAALLLTGFTGVVRLAGRLAIGTPGTRLVAGMAYALSPVALTVAGQTSGELLPISVVPWIVLPLTSMRPWLSGPAGPGTGRGRTASRARAVARSAVAIALCSGLNAASTFAAVVPCGWYILTRPGTATRGRLLAWWLPATALITVSWSVPLLLLSRYGVSIVPYTESTQVTATTTSLVDILRGTENWIGYQSTSGVPNRPLAFGIDTGVVQATLAGALAALGLAGLARRDLPERRFLLWLALGGIVVISLGYASSLGSPLEGPLVALINGPASAFRNLWKFDPLVRLPVAMGLAHLLAAPWRIKARTASTRTVLRAVAAVALASLVLPTATTGLASPGSFSQIPSYWVAAGGWLTTHAGKQAVLVEPGAGFSEYTWGSPMDDVLQGLTNVDFAERNLGVVGSAGNERLLDAIDQEFAAGDGSAGLTTVLARMGIKYVLVRNDLAGSQLTGTSPARVQDTVSTSPGLTLVARFGPQVPDDAPQDVLAGVTARYPAIEVYQVAGAEPAAVVQPTTGTLRLAGAPESLITLANEGLLGTSPVLLNSDGAGDQVAGAVVTDSLRRRVVNFGQLRTNYSPTLTATEPADTFLSIDDFTEPGWSAYEAVAQYSGIRDVTASSSASDLQASTSQWASGVFPYSAFDGNPDTMWESDANYGPLGQWIQGTFDSTIRFGQGSDTAIGVAFADNPDVGPPVTRVTVSTSAGQVSDSVRITGSLQSLRVPAGPSDWLRITVTGLAPLSAASLDGTQAGIATIDVPGLTASRTIVAPPVPAGSSGGQQATVVLAKAQPYQPGCELAAARWVCSPVLATTSEEQYGFNESVTEPSSQVSAVRGTAVLTAPALIAKDALSGPGQPVVTPSSTETDDPQDQAWNAFDGNQATSWIASPSDPHPTLSISWQAPATVSQLTIERPPNATGLTQVLITGSGGQRRGAMVPKSGKVRFAAMTTTRLTLTFTTDQAPVQVSDVAIPGVPFIRATAQISLGCGQGPRLSVGGVSVPTEVTATSADLLDGRPVSFQACDPVRLPAGTTAVTESASDAFDAQDVVLAPFSPAHHPTHRPTGLPGTAAGTTAAPPTAATVVSWGSSRRTLRVTATARSYLEVNENFNAGWQAVIDGRTLRPVQLDGWKQAWVLPAGNSGVVTLTYQPAATYRDAIGAGLAALLLCLAASLLPAGGAPLPWMTGPWMTGPWMTGQRRPGRRRLRRWPTVAGAAAALAVVGLVLGGYPGAVLLPVVTGLLLLPSRGRRRGRHGPDQRDRDTVDRPLLLGGLLAVASAIGAVGEHLVYSGDSGLTVTALSDAIPQVLCLLVVGGLAACLPGALAPPSDAPRGVRGVVLSAEGNGAEPPSPPSDAPRGVRGVVPPGDSALDAHGEEGT
jgi:arabinofuranan 3-O-arabinosyltransferase